MYALAKGLVSLLEGKEAPEALTEFQPVRIEE